MSKFVPLAPLDRLRWLHPPFFKSTQKIAELEHEVDELKLRLANIEKWALSLNQAAPV